MVKLKRSRYDGEKVTSRIFYDVRVNECSTLIEGRGEVVRSEPHASETRKEPSNLGGYQQ